MSQTWQLPETLKPFIKENWIKSGFEHPTSIQEKALPEMIEGKDVLIESPPGTGKTVTYLLPILQKIDAEKGGAQAVVIAPSRELVMQIYEQFQNWSAGSGITGASFIGGANVKRQLEKLKKRPQFIVGTPGRVNELIKLKKLKMHEVKTIVLDEVDQLFVPENMATIKQIVGSTLNDRQLLLVSATVPEQVEKYAFEMMKDPISIKVDMDAQQLSKVEHSYFLCEAAREKMDVLRKIAHIPSIKALVFVKDIGNLAVMAEKLKFKGIELGMLHSDLDKREREATLKNFRAGNLSLLLVTDVAARGLDIQGVTHVIHYGFPENLNQFVHRSGRTGRMGAEGTVMTIVVEREERELKKYARELKIELHKKSFYKGKIIDIK